MAHPDQVMLTAVEAHRINRVRLALRLNRLPGEIDAAPLRDIADLVEVMNADEKIAALRRHLK